MVAPPPKSGRMQTRSAVRSGPRRSLERVQPARPQQCASTTRPRYPAQLARAEILTLIARQDADEKEVYGTDHWRRSIVHRAYVRRVVHQHREVGDSEALRHDRRVCRHHQVRSRDEQKRREHHHDSPESRTKVPQRSRHHRTGIQAIAQPHHLNAQS